jgi:hypothetical protein
MPKRAVRHRFYEAFHSESLWIGSPILGRNDDITHIAPDVVEASRRAAKPAFDSHM